MTVQEILDKLAEIKNNTKELMGNASNSGETKTN